MDELQDFNIHNNHKMFEDMVKAEEICAQYNAIPTSHFEERMNLLW